MSKLRSFKRHLDPAKVWLANHVAEDRIKVARQAVMERAKKDAEFAAEVLRVMGDSLPKEVKEACEESVKAQVLVAENPEAKIVADAVIRLDDGMVVVQSDGGGELIVHETELPDYPRDGDEPPLDITEKLVQMDGSKLEKSTDDVDLITIP